MFVHFATWECCDSCDDMLSSLSSLLLIAFILSGHVASLSIIQTMWYDVTGTPGSHQGSRVPSHSITFHGLLFPSMRCHSFAFVWTLLCSIYRTPVSRLWPQNWSGLIPAYSILFILWVAISNKWQLLLISCWLLLTLDQFSHSLPLQP